jgi:hypothetical protein
MPERSREAFAGLAGALAENPVLIRRLLLAHPPSPGVCRGCSVPGGRMVVESPCSIRVLAALARTIHDARVRADRPARARTCPRPDAAS